jgi:hypothetical protein
MSPEMDGALDDAMLLLEHELREGIEFETDDPEPEVDSGLVEEFGPTEELAAMGAETLFL